MVPVVGGMFVTWAISGLEITLEGMLIRRLRCRKKEAGEVLGEPNLNFDSYF